MRWTGWMVLATMGLMACQSARIPLYHQDSYSTDTLPQPPNVPALFTAFGIGDAGSYPAAEPVLSMLREQLRVVSPSRSAVFYLGDNLYPNGVPDSASASFAQASAIWQAQVAATANFNGPVWWIPGNHDWGQPAAANVIDRQRQWVAAIDKPSRRFYPRETRPFWHLTILANEVLVVALDSERWLLAEEPEAFREMQHLIDTIGLYKDFPKLLLTHHPAFSDGPHGGRFGIKQHLFPLTDVVKWAYIPLPVIGSLYPLLRSTIGHPQDLTHARYATLQHLFNGLLSQHSNWVVLSGHEHALQYIRANDDHYLIAGSGSKVSAVYPRKHSVFAYSHTGMVQVSYYADKSVWATFWLPDQFEVRGRAVFSRRLY